MKNTVEDKKNVKKTEPKNKAMRKRMTFYPVCGKCKTCERKDECL